MKLNPWDGFKALRESGELLRDSLREKQSKKERKSKVGEKTHESILILETRSNFERKLKIGDKQVGENVKWMPKFEMNKKN